MTAATPAEKTPLRFARLTTWVGDNRPGGPVLALVAGLVAAAISVGAVFLAGQLADLVVAQRSGLLTIILPVVAGIIIAAVRWRLPATTTGIEPILAGSAPRLLPSVVTAALGLVTASGMGIVGREEPVIGLAAMVSSRLRWLQRSISVRGLVACSFAGGAGVVLGSPFVALALVFETVVGRVATTEFMPVAAAALFGSMLSRSPIGPGALVVPEEPAGWGALGAAVVIAAVLALALPSSLGLVADLVRRSSIATLVMPPLVGLIVGVIAYVAPGTLSPGGGLEGAVIALVLVVLLVAILGSGGAGGVLVPAIGLALAIGGTLASVLEPVIPQVIPSLVTVCLATVVAGAFRAPIAGAAVAVSAGGDTTAVVALAVAAVFVGLISRQLEPRTAFDAIQWEQPVLPTAAATVRVSDVLEPVDPVSLDATLEDVATLLEDRPVVDRHGHFVGMIGANDADRARFAGISRFRVIDFVRQPGLIAWPYSTVADAFSQPDADRESLLPVVSTDGRRVLGVVRRSAIGQ